MKWQKKLLETMKKDAMSKKWKMIENKLIK